jgi:voltage-gated potassium channel
MPIKSILTLLVLLLLITFGGAIGYMFLEGWPFFDSLYMTIITLTTTGFGEVKPLSSLGRVFTMILLVMGVGLVAYSATTFINVFFSYNWAERRKRKMDKKILALRDHTIIIGFGRMGKIICKELHEAGHEFVVIEKHDQLHTDLQNSPYLWMAEDAAQDENLWNAGIENAKNLVIMIDDDADALYITLAARSLNREIEILVRANAESAKKKLKLAGADKVILPFVMSGHKVAESILNPAVEDLLNISGVKGGQGQLQIADIIVSKKSYLVNMTLGNCGILREEMIVVGIKKPDRSFIFAPKEDYIFEIGDCIIALGSKENYERILLGMEKAV